MNVAQNIKLNFSYYKRQLAIFIMIAFFISLIPMVFCVNPSGDWHDATGLCKSVINNVQDVFSGMDVTEIAKNVNIEYSDTALKIGNLSLSSGIVTAIVSISAIFRNMAVTLYIIYFLVGIMEDFSLQAIYLEKLLKKAIYFVAGFILIANSMDIVYGIANIGTQLAQKITSTGAAHTVDIEPLLNQIYYDCNQEYGSGPLDSLKEMANNTVAAISYNIQILFPYLAAKACNIIIQVICWSRFFEITFIGIMSPLSVIDVAAKGSLEQSSCMRMLKNIIALAISGALIILICYMCNQISGSLIVEASVSTGNFLSVIWKVVVISIVQAGLVKQSTDIAKKALGFI